jgi:UDP-N-acetylmuramoylalanine--D-glutamate ligase
VTGEIELAAGYIERPILAVTGTNGKTTSCELIAAMLTQSGKSVFLGGNIGNPLITYPDQPTAADVLVVEVSSFQLDTISTFRPRVGVLLNISPDHLDRYADFEAYAASKMRLFENQKHNDTAILNAGDPVIERLSTDLVGRKWVYPHLKDQKSGAVLEKDSIRLSGLSASPGEPSEASEHRIRLDRFQPVGQHNRENACAAALAAVAAGAIPAGIQSAIDAFRGLPHRMEWVAEVDGVAYLNDSKATNVDSVARALECFEGPVVLIMGGQDKGGRFESLLQLVANRCRFLIVCGAAADRIRTALETVVAVRKADRLDEAVQMARDEAKRGDTVLLSPGCASFDQYSNYRERGRDFKAVVASLK